MELLTAPMRFDAEVDQKPPAVWNTTATALSWPHKGKASVSWQSTATSTDGTLRKVTSIVAEADGAQNAFLSHFNTNTIGTKIEYVENKGVFVQAISRRRCHSQQLAGKRSRCPVLR